jgi:hypothetical protein
LAGRGEATLANLLILNIRNSENPIRVISIADLLDATMNGKDLINGHEPFITKFKNLPAFPN